MDFAKVRALPSLPIPLSSLILFSRTPRSHPFLSVDVVLALFMELNDSWMANFDDATSMLIPPPARAMMYTPEEFAAAQFEYEAT